MEKLKPKLRFPEFKDQWFQKKLGDVFSITSASRVHKNEWKDNGVRFFRTSDVISHYKGTDNIKAFISFELYESLSNKIGRVNKNDLLITGGGSIGIPYLISNDEPLYFKDADLLWIKNVDEINGFFLYTFFLTEYFRDYLNSISHTGTIAHYTVNQAKNTPFNFPSLPEQTKIASFLSTVDEKLNLLKEKKSALEVYKKGMMQKIFSQEIRFKPAPSDTSGDENGKGFAEWEEKSLGEILTFGSGRDYKHLREGNIPVYGTGGLMTLVDDFLFDGESVCIGRKGTIDKPVYLNCKFWTVDTLFYTHSFKQVLPKFILYVFQSINWKEYNEASGVPSLSKSTLEKIQVKIPLLEEQSKIASFLSAIDEKIDLISEQIESTQEYKNGLLQQMFC